MNASISKMSRPKKSMEELPEEEGMDLSMEDLGEEESMGPDLADIDDEVLLAEARKRGLIEDESDESMDLESEDDEFAL